MPLKIPPLPSIEELNRMPGPKPRRRRTTKYKRLPNCVKAPSGRWIHRCGEANRRLQVADTSDCPPLAVWRKLRKGQSRYQCKAPPKPKKPPNLKWKYRKYLNNTGVPKYPKKNKKNDLTGIPIHSATRTDVVEPAVNHVVTSTDVTSQVKRNIINSAYEAVRRVEWARKHNENRARRSNME